MIVYFVFSRKSSNGGSASARGAAPSASFFNQLQTAIVPNPVSAKLVAKATHQINSGPPPNLMSASSAMQVRVDGFQNAKSRWANKFLNSEIDKKNCRKVFRTHPASHPSKRSPLEMPKRKRTRSTRSNCPCNSHPQFRRWWPRTGHHWN